MKCTTLILILAVLFTVSCSKVQTTSVLAEKWDTGQHRTCLYGHSRLYCGKPEEITEFKPPVTPYKWELLRPELVKDSRTDGGSYETKFTSHTPMDFSTWDCYKTGTGSPAVVCDLKRKSTKEESDAFVKSEKEQQEQSRLEQVAYKYLMQLEPVTLLVACGRGEKSGGQKLPYSGVNDLREDTRIKYPFGDFRFSYLGAYDKNRKRCDANSASSCEPSYLLAYAEASQKVWTLDFQIKYHEAALDVVQNVPCLFSQVQLRDNQRLPGDRAANSDGVPVLEL